MPSRTANTFVLHRLRVLQSARDCFFSNLVAVFGAQFWEIGTKFNLEFSLENSERAEYGSIYNKLRNNRPRKVSGRKTAESGRYRR